MKVMIRVSIFLFVLMFSNCSFIYVWNPVLSGVELNQKLSFNKDGIAVSIPSFGFFNHSSGPVAIIETGNYTQDTLYLVKNNFKLVFEGDTLAWDHHDSLPIEVLPGGKIDFSIDYHQVLNTRVFNVEGGKKRYSSSTRDVQLLIGEFMKGSESLKMPNLVYRNPEKLITRSGVTEFKLVNFIE